MFNYAHDVLKRLQALLVINPVSKHTVSGIIVTFLPQE